MAELDYPNGHLLASFDWLAAHLDDPTVKLIDARTPREYAEGHIPGALPLPSGAFRATGGVPDTCTAEEFAALAGALGIRPTDTVVAYEGTGGGRAWWVFARFGHQNVRFLNGSLKHWAAGGRPVAIEPAAAPAAVTYPLGAVADHMACSLPQAVGWAGKDEVLFWDVRSEGEYTGADPRNNPAHRAGHLPKAVHLEWTDLTDTATDMFKPAAEMRALLANKGITPEKEVVAY